MDITVIEALDYRSKKFDGVSSCTKNELLGTIMERIVNKEVHRLVIVDEENRVQGVLSLSDILTYIILKQETSQSSSNESNVMSTGRQTPTFSKLQKEEDITDSPTGLINTKTTSLTTAFGLTRLMETNTDSLMMTTNENDGSAFLISTKHNILPSQQSNSPAAVLKQPKISKIMNNDDQTIFDDDPMEDDSQTTTVIS